MNIIIAYNDSYSAAGRAMLLSFFKYNSKSNHDIYAVYNSLSNDNKLKLKKLVEDNNSTLHMYYVDEKRLEGLVTHSHFTVETYFGFFVLDVIPDSEDRALWLDLDMCISGSLEDFYNVDFKNNLLAGCMEQENIDQIIDRLSLKNHVYINSGVMLFNLKKIRKVYKTEDFFEHYIENKDLFIWLDQDLYNYLFDGRILVMNQQVYNMQVTSHNPNTYDCRAWKRAKVIHYVGSPKPWNVKYPYKIGNLFRKYYFRTIRIDKAFCFLLKICIYKVMLIIQNIVLCCKK